jgi:hypothetical protein
MLLRLEALGAGHDALPVLSALVLSGQGAARHASRNYFIDGKARQLAQSPYLQNTRYCGKIGVYRRREEVIIIQDIIKCIAKPESDVVASHSRYNCRGIAATRAFRSGSDFGSTYGRIARIPC